MKFIKNVVNILLGLLVFGCSTAPRSYFVPVKGAKLKVIERGPKDKRPVILVHGGPGGAGYMWTLAEHLEDFRTIEYYQRDATNSPSKGPYLLNNHIEDLHQLVQSFSKKPILIGHSWGGTLLCEYGKRYSSEVEKMILIAPGTINKEMDDIHTENTFKSAGKNEARARRLYKKLQATKDKSEYAKIMKEYFPLIIKSVCYNCTEEAGNKMRNNPVKKTDDDFLANRKTSDQYWSLVKSGKLEKGLSRIKDPVVHIQPEFDLNAPELLIKVLSQNIKNYKLFKISNTGHIPWLEPQSQDETIRVLKSELLLDGSR